MVHYDHDIYRMLLNEQFSSVTAPGSVSELKWNGGWSTGTIDWLSASEQGNTWKGVPRWTPSAWFHFHSCQTWYSGLLRIFLMAHQCWYHPKHSNQARME